MKFSILLLVLIILTAPQLGAQTHSKSPKNNILSATQHSTRTSGEFTYMLTVHNEPYVELTGATSVNNGEVWDDPTYVVPIGFTFELNGNPITMLQFNGVGSLMLGNVTNPDILSAVFPFEVDILDRGFVSGVSESPISYVVEGTEPNRIFKLEIKNAGSYFEFEIFGTTDMYISHQLWLYEGSNQIDFRYGENLIEIPDLFYLDGGAFVGLTDIDVSIDEFVNPHFIGGSAETPILSVNDVTLEGTPGEDVVYRLSLPQALEILVTGINSTSNCNPNGSATATVTGGTAPYSYEWSNGETTPTILNLDAGTYTVTVTDALGAAGTGSVDITNVGPINPNAFATDETSVDANDGTATSAAFGGSPPYDYAWSNGETTQSITGLAPGDYTVTVTDDVGCTGTQTVTVNPFECAGIEIEVFISDASCHGLCDGFIDLLDIAGATPPYTYIWSNGLSTEDAFNLCAGEYSLTVIDANGCTITGGPFVIEEPPVLLANAGASPETSADANNGQAWANPTGGTPPYSYLWSNDSTDQTITNLAPGTYGVTVTDNNGCLDSQMVVVNEFLCTGTVTPWHIDMSCYFLCDGEAGVVVSGGVGPFTYQWNTGDTSYFISNLCSGTYSVLITDVGANCTGLEVFDILAPDTLAMTVDQVIHYNNLTAGIINITATGGTPPYTYQWDGPNGYTSVDEDISGLAPGLYFVMVVDANGCAISTDSIEIKDETVSTNNVVNLDVRIYPNPANEQVFIDLEDVSGFRIKLTGMDGRVMKNWDAERILNVSAMPAGLYLLEGVSEDGIFRKQLSILR